MDLWIRAVISCILSVGVSVRSLKKRSLSPSGAIASVLVGFISFYCGNRFAMTLLSFFFSGSWVTKIGHHLKHKLEDDYKEGGQRTWEQVMANGATGTLLALLYYLLLGIDVGLLDSTSSPIGCLLLGGFIGHYACCCGDTFASELGILARGDPVLITTLQKVPPGTNGAISLVGTAASALGGAIVGGVFYLSQVIFVVPLNGYQPPHSQAIVVLLGAAAGVLGSMVDSVLGATVQYSGFVKQRNIVVEAPSPTATRISGMDLFSGDQVNFCSSLITTIITALCAYFFF